MHIDHLLIKDAFALVFKKNELKRLQEELEKEQRRAQMNASMRRRRPQPPPAQPEPVEEMEEEEVEPAPSSSEALEAMVDVENREAKRRKTGLFRYWRVVPKKDK